ncbi:hypothetical protein ACV0BM_003380 [Elizabethkingia meningoseptica]
MGNYIKEIKALLIFGILGLLVAGFIFILAYFKIEYYFYFSFIAYILICMILTVLSDRLKSTLLKKVIQIILIPGNLILSIGTVLIPFGFILIHLFYYFGIPILIPIILLELLDFFKITFIENQETKLYIKFTSTVFIAVLFNYQLRKIIYKISPARINTSKKLKPYELDKLTDYLLSENNVRFLIYSLYVVLLIIVNFENFENKSLSKSLITDKSILQSFVTFIAFDRALALLKQLEFKPSDFLNKIIKSILNKYQDLNKTEDNDTP